MISFVPPSHFVLLRPISSGQRDGGGSGIKPTSLRPSFYSLRGDEGLRSHLWGFGELRPDNEINQHPFSSFSSDLLLTIEVISESTSPKPNEL